MEIHILMFLTIVKLNFWTLTVMSQQLVHINNFNCLLQFLLVTVTQIQKREKIVNRRALMCGVKLTKKPSIVPFFGTSGVNIVIDHPVSVADVVNTIIGDDLIRLLTEQSKLHHRQNEQKWKMLRKTLKWSNITPEEMRKFMGLIILMGQVRKESVRDYWSTDPTISTPIFPQTMSRNCFESIWQPWHFSDNSQQRKDSGGLVKIFPLYEYFLQKFRSVYSPKQELSLDEAMIPWWGRLAFRTYNPGKKNETRITGENGV